MKNYYEILGLDKSVSNNKLRTRILEIAEDCHPKSSKFIDKNAEKFIKAFVAFDILLNPTYRLAYNQIERAKRAEMKSDVIEVQLLIIESAEIESRLRAESLCQSSLADFKELYKNESLWNLFRIFSRLRI